MRREKALKRREALQHTRRMAAEAAEKLALKSSEATPPPSDDPPGAASAIANAATHHADHPCALRLYTPDEHSASLLTPLPHHKPAQSLNPSLMAPSATPRHEPPLPVAANARAAAWLPARPLELSPQELGRRQQQLEAAQRVSSLPSVAQPRHANAECVCPACAPTSSRVLRFANAPPLHSTALLVPVRAASRRALRSCRRHWAEGASRVSLSSAHLERRRESCSARSATA